jgi:glycogen debranching enzyme
MSILLNAPHCVTSSQDLNHAYRIAIGDLISNITPFQDGLLTRPEPVMIAGLDYVTPWTRDAAINTENAGALLVPEVARNTLLSVVEKKEDGLFIGGEYWDAIIWVLGAWSLYLSSGDREFLKLAYEAGVYTLDYKERTEQDPDDGLFRGAAVYGDGVSAYPDVYTACASGGIMRWLKANHPKKASIGVGLPMKALSTNCLYYHVYHVLADMARELGVPVPEEFAAKAEALRARINKEFWREDAGCYRYLVDPFGGDDRHEGFGHAFAILFGVADARQRDSVFSTQTVTPAGMIPCVWPTYGRYRKEDPDAFGRHSGCIWPQINAYWCEAAARHGRGDILERELGVWAKYVCRDSQFLEVYHPVTGAVYGGVQEGQGGMIGLLESCRRQTWCATGFLRAIHHGVLGMRIAPDGIRFSPCVPEGVAPLRVSGLRYREAEIDVEIAGAGTKASSILINGQENADGWIPATCQGKVAVKITMSRT